MITWDVAIYFVVLFDKFDIPVGQKMDLYETQRQSGCTIVSDIDESFSGDHNLKCDKVIAYVIHSLNISKYVKAYQYSGGPEVNGNISVALHDSTLGPSDVFTHNACVLNYMGSLSTSEMN